MASDFSPSSTSRPQARSVDSLSLVGVGGLERLAVAVDGLRAGIVELEQVPSYLMLSDAGPGTATAAEFSTAVRQTADFWPLLDALTERIAEARRFVEQHRLVDKTLGKAGKGGDSRRHHELTEILAQPLTIALTDGPRELSLRSTVELLHQRYDAVHRGVSRIDRVWLDVLPRVEASRETVERLQSEADALGVVEPLIGRAQRRAEDLAERLVTDPIGVPDDAGLELDRLISEAARQMAGLRTGHDSLNDDMTRTEELLATLRVLRTRAAAAADEARHKIVAPAGLVTVPGRAIIDGPGGLAERLDVLVQLVAEGGGQGWTRQRVLLDQWLAMAEKLERQLDEAGRRNRGDLDRRDELRGRLHAFQAKMAATGHAESPRSMELVEAAWTELYTAPTDLQAAEESIVQLAHELRKR